MENSSPFTFPGDAAEGFLPGGAVLGACRGRLEQMLAPGPSLRARGTQVFLWLRRPRSAAMARMAPGHLTPNSTF